MPNSFGQPTPESSPAHGADEADAEHLLALAPYRGFWTAGDYPQARVVKADCGHHAWLSPQGEAYVATCRTSCLDCLPATDDPHAILVAGALDYVREHFGDECAERARRFAKDHGIAEH